jgi:hypothetical protein
MKKMTLLGASALLVAGMLQAESIAREAAKDQPDKPTIRRGANHLIFPVETPLQRLLVRRGNAKVFVVVNGTGCYNKGEFDPAVIDALRRDLGQSASAGDTVQFSIFFGANSGGLDPEPLKQALGRLADDLGLQSAPAEMEWRNDFVTWKQKLAQMDEGLPAGARGDETGIGDDETMVYPVRTHLSRYLTGADAYVQLKGSLSGDSEKGKTSVATIRSSVSRLHVARKKRISFHFYTLPEMNDAERRQFMKDLEGFTRSLGFENFLLTVGGHP